MESWDPDPNNLVSEPSILRAMANKKGCAGASNARTTNFERNLQSLRDELTAQVVAEQDAVASIQRSAAELRRSVGELQRTVATVGAEMRLLLLETRPKAPDPVGNVTPVVDPAPISFRSLPETVGGKTLTGVAAAASTSVPKNQSQWVRPPQAVLFNGRSVMDAKARVYKKTRTPPLHSGVGCYLRPKLHGKRRMWVMKANPGVFFPEFDEALCHLSMAPTTLAHTSPQTTSTPLMLPVEAMEPENKVELLAEFRALLLESRTPTPTQSVGLVVSEPPAADLALVSFGTVPEVAGEVLPMALTSTTIVPGETTVAEASQSAAKGNTPKSPLPYCELAHNEVILGINSELDNLVSKSVSTTSIPANDVAKTIESTKPVYDVNGSSSSGTKGGGGMVDNSKGGNNVSTSRCSGNVKENTQFCQSNQYLQHSNLGLYPFNYMTGPLPVTYTGVNPNFTGYAPITHASTLDPTLLPFPHYGSHYSPYQPQTSTATPFLVPGTPLYPLSPYSQPMLPQNTYPNNISAEQDEHGLNLLIKSKEYHAPHLFDKMPKTDELCNARSFDKRIEASSMVASISTVVISGSKCEHTESVAMTDRVTIVSISKGVSRDIKLLNINENCKSDEGIAVYLAACKEDKQSNFKGGGDAKVSSNSSGNDKKIGRMKATTPISPICGSLTSTHLSSLRNSSTSTPACINEEKMVLMVGDFELTRDASHMLIYQEKSVLMPHFSQLMLDEEHYSEVTILHSRLEAPLLCHLDVSELMMSLGEAYFQIAPSALHCFEFMLPFINVGIVTIVPSLFIHTWEFNLDSLEPPLPTSGHYEQLLWNVYFLCVCRLYGTVEVLDNAYSMLAFLCAGCSLRTFAILDVGSSKLLMEFHCALQPRGYFVWSATPVYQKLHEDAGIWKTMFGLTQSVCCDLLGIIIAEPKKLIAATGGTSSMKEGYNERELTEPTLCNTAAYPLYDDCYILVLISNDMLIVWVATVSSCLFHVLLLLMGISYQSTTAVFVGYMHNGCSLESLESYSDKEWVGLLQHSITTPSVRLACAQSSTMCMGRSVQVCGIKLGSTVSTVSNILVDLHAKGHIIRDAQCIFVTTWDMNVLPWSSSTCGNSLDGFAYEALHLCLRMRPQSFQLVAFTLVSVPSACASCGILQVYEESCFHGYVAMPKGKQLQAMTCDTSWDGALGAPVGTQAQLLNDAVQASQAGLLTSLIPCALLLSIMQVTSTIAAALTHLTSEVPRHFNAMTPTHTAALPIVSPEINTFAQRQIKLEVKFFLEEGGIVRN